MLVIKCTPVARLKTLVAQNFAIAENCCDLMPLPNVCQIFLFNTQLLQLLMH